MFKKKIHLCRLLVIFLLFLLLLGSGCSKSTSTIEYWVKGELIVRLYDDITGENLEKFVSDYSQYQFEFIKYVYERLNMGLFRFNHKIIDELLFLEIIQNDERVMYANFNRYIGPS